VNRRNKRCRASTWNISGTRISFQRLFEKAFVRSRQCG